MRYVYMHRFTPFEPAYSIQRRPCSTNAKTCTYTFSHMHMYARTYTHIHTQARAHTHTYRQRQTHAWTHTHRHRQTHTYIHTRTYIHIHIHRHTHSHVCTESPPEYQPNNRIGSYALSPNCAEPLHMARIDDLSLSLNSRSTTRVPSMRGGSGFTGRAFEASIRWSCSSGATERGPVERFKIR